MIGPRLEVCYLPSLLVSGKGSAPRNIVVVDILRATTSMCTAFGFGVRSILPLTDASEAQQMKQDGWIVAGEQDGEKLPFAHYGNSPVEFRTAEISAKDIAYCTTNGTKAIKLAQEHGQVFIASFVNLEAVAGWLSRDRKDVVILCSGWKGRYSLEDALFAGALADLLVNAFQFIADSDEALASMILWRNSARRLMATVSKSSHYLRLLGIENRRGLKYCFFPEKFMVVPALSGGRLVDIYEAG
jgi:2-phosphosulfolactate phosphatase